MSSRIATEVSTTLPPSLASHPLIQTYRFIARPLDLLDECHRRFGDIFTLKLMGMGNWVLLSSPEDLKTMFTGPPEVLHAGEANHSVFGSILGSSTVVTLDESAHLHRRRVLLPPFHGDRIQAYLRDMGDIAAQVVDAWPVGKPFSMHREMQRIALGVILKVIFGIQQNEERARWARLMMELANVTASPLIFAPALQWDLGRYSPWGKIMHSARAADSAIYGEIARRRARPPEEAQGDLFSLLLQVRHEDGRPLTDLELRDELVTLLLAGHETTASALAWTFERILSLPDVYAKLKEELDSALEGGAFQPEQVSRLDYLDAVIKETHRSRPIMPFGGSRRVKAPFEIGGYRVPAGTTLTNCMYLLHRRSDIYPEPEHFRPERFLGKKADPYAWTPFGGGMRRCLGMAFAHAEMKAVVATVFSRARLRIESPHAKHVRRGFFLVPEGGPKVVLEERTA